ncbi:uncharacterized protein LOC126965321 [Leptidea sinapis]|uniref:uncharacterized protein LOC126965321 n=1 Tax=Leptidea sinapis TaxID=189913 RepID=UPI00213B79F8|nr:uncharacterized protein LOC126965321 [Leptidea sinapis]
MSTDLSASFNEQYVNINTKLKKRIMRKPNVSEATKHEFIGLAIQCEHSEQPTFAGQTYIGAAKCEAAIGNFLGEAEQYIAAARQFIKAEKKLATLKFFSPDRENLEAAIGCFIQALSKYPEKSPIRTWILLEIANNLIELDHKLEAAAYFEQALETLQEDNMMKVTCLHNLFNLQIDCDKYDIALRTGNTIVDSKHPLPGKLLSELQVSRILLGLITELDGKNNCESLKKLFSDLQNDEDNEMMPFSTDLKLKLQSIIISSSMSDHQALLSISNEVKPYLNNLQKSLLETLIKKKQEE